MKYCIVTYGCQMNESDSQKIAVLLQKQGHKPAKNEVEANLIVLNCCSVRQAAMHRVYDKVQKYYGNKNVILAGCVLEKDKNTLKEKVSEIWHPDNYFECQTLELNAPHPPLKIRGGENKDADAPSLDSREGWGELNYIPIMTGCNNFCSYCAVPYTRGREKSRPADEIIAEAKSLIKNGVKEIMLLGQNVNSFSSSPRTRGGLRRGNSEFKITTPNPSLYKEGRNSENVNFATLLKTINDLPGSFRLSFMTSHPKDMSDELIKTMAKCEKLVKNLHLPIQSGDDTILKKMNRKYTTKHYLDLLKKIRKVIPGIKISTDIIVGFPGETKRQFTNTVKLCKTVKFSGAYIAKYSPRPGTAAARLKDDVPIAEKKRRWKILDTLINKFEH